MKPCKIGSLKLKNPFFLAPMAGTNDIAFRTLCKKAGAALVYTGMINPLTKEKLNLEDKPAIQIFAKSEQGIREFIKKYDSHVSLWDFNLACPAPVAKNQGVGYFLQDLRIIEKILRTMRQSTKKPVTIKLRISDKNEEIIRIAEKYCDAIAIHPRTQKQGYSGTPEMEYAEKIKEMAKLPVIYSGNVDEKNARKLVDKFDFIMIGRKAMGNPGIFSELMGKKKIIGFGHFLKLAGKYNLYFSQIKLQAMNFTKNMDNAKKRRRKLILAKTVEEVEKIMS
jgi:tRNA-dihydrouridine synthase B